MILLDENQQLVYDCGQRPSGRTRETLIQANATCFYASQDVLYRFNDKGTLFLISLSRPLFHSLHVKKWERELFQRERRVATDDAVIRDVGCGKSCVYMDGHSFYIPTELMFR